MNKTIFLDLDKSYKYMDKKIYKTHSTNDIIKIIENKCKSTNKSISLFDSNSIRELGNIDVKKVVPIVNGSAQEYLSMKSLKYFFDYAITSYGTTVIHKGRIDEEYKEIVLSYTKNISKISNDLCGTIIDDTYIIADSLKWDIYRKYQDKYKCLFDNRSRIIITPKQITVSIACNYIITKLKQLDRVYIEEPQIQLINNNYFNMYFNNSLVGTY